ncbi:MAG: hypothetical protein IPK99_18165 [Flavobacteriales bacterium]|nr:hypothetical protein [Flavobacteriales bacterium]
MTFFSRHGRGSGRVGGPERLPAGRHRVLGHGSGGIAHIGIVSRRSRTG